MNNSLSTPHRADGRLQSRGTGTQTDHGRSERQEVFTSCASPSGNSLTRCASSSTMTTRGLTVAMTFSTNCSCARTRAPNKGFGEGDACA